MNQYKNATKVKDFFIGPAKISLKNIYELFNKDFKKIESQIQKNQKYSNEEYNLEIFNVNQGVIECCFSKKFLINILYPSIEIKFIINDQEKKYPLVSDIQFRKLIEELNFKSPEINYIKNNIVFKEKCIFTNYCNLYNNYNKGIYIKEKIYLKIMSEEMLENIKKNDMKGFLGVEFNSPKDFDKNYFLYFPNKKDIKYKSFKIYKNKAREKLANIFHQVNYELLAHYFGQQSMGKSITLIGSLKYNNPHHCRGTIYINCKTLDYYFKNNVDIAKQLLIDEIAYLFVNQYEIYKKCAESIQNYQVNLKDEKETYWNLIDIIMSYLNERAYVISFDQYNSKVDPLNRLKEVWNEKKRKEKNNEWCYITIFTLSSMNNSDIKEYKISTLLNESPNNDWEYYEEIKEDLISETDLTFEDKEIDDKLEYIGRTTDNYIIFKSLIEEKRNIDDFIFDRKNHLKTKIYQYFGINNNINITEAENLYKFLSFSVYTKYELSEIKRVCKNIPFKYFNIKLKNSKKENKDYVKLNYRFGVIKDIIEEIYSFIILRKDFSHILSNEFLDGGGKGIFFEKIVIHHFTPGEHNYSYVNFFGEFVIVNTCTINQFIPKSNEKKKLKNKKVNIQNRPFLLKQSNFGGKCLDFIVVDYNGNNNADFYCFQITELKKKKDLLTYESLKSNIIIMVEYMKNFFDFEIYSVYFSYIFDFNKLKERKVKNMCSNCTKEKIKYIFYDLNTLSFFDEKKHIINNNIKKYANEFSFTKNKRNPYINFELTEEQEDEIKKILRETYKNPMINFKYLRSDNILDVKSVRDYALFGITEFNFVDFNSNKYKETLMLYFDNKNICKCIKLAKDGKTETLSKLFDTLFLLQHTFDYYKILK